MRMVKLAVGTILLGALAVACGGAGPDESTGSAEGAQKACGQPNTAPCPNPNPDPPPPACTWNPPAAWGGPCPNPKPYSSEGYSPYCVPSTLHTRLANAQRVLQGMGCSNPVSWSAVGDPNLPNDNGWAHIQACPNSSEVTDYLASLPMMPSADHAPHPNRAFCSRNVPYLPDGYIWAVVSEDPHCMGNACMVSPI